MTELTASPDAKSDTHRSAPGAPVGARPLGLRFVVDVTNEPWRDHDAAQVAERWTALCTEHGDDSFGGAPAQGPALRNAVAEVRRLLATTDSQAAASALNAALASTAAAPELVQLPDGRWVTRPTLPDDPSAALVYRTLAAAALANWFAERGRPAWGHCAAAHCENVLIDEGRRAPQRFCSPTCATRTRVAAHRRGIAG